MPKAIDDSSNSSLRCFVPQKGTRGKPVLGPMSDHYSRAVGICSVHVDGELNPRPPKLGFPYDHADRAEFEERVDTFLHLV